MNRKLLIALAALSIAALGLVACGDDDETTTQAETTEETTTDEAAAGGSGGGGGKGGTIEVVADPEQLAYTTGDLTVDSGTVTIDFENPASIGHDVRIEDSSGNDVGGTEVITESSESVELELEPGDYQYYCSVGGHRPAGMEQALTVE